MDPFTKSIFDPTVYLCEKKDNTYTFLECYSSYTADQEITSNKVFIHNISWFIPKIAHRTILESRLARSIAIIR